MVQQGRRRHNHPIDALQPVLMRFIAFCWTTAGVEQTFASWRQVVPSNRTCQDDTVNDDLMVMCECNCHAKDAIISKAQHEWANVYGSARSSSRMPRIDKGLTRPINKKVMTESRWIQHRRREVRRRLLEASTSSSTSAHQRINARAQKLAQRAWSGTFEKEEAFQRQKRQYNFVEAMVRNHALPEETTDDHRSLAIREIEGDIEKRKKYNSARLNVQRQKPQDAVQLGPSLASRTVSRNHKMCARHKSRSQRTFGQQNAC